MQAAGQRMGYFGQTTSGFVLKDKDRPLAWNRLLAPQLERPGLEAW
jgi:hypothetical protein